MFRNSNSSKYENVIIIHKFISAIINKNKTAPYQTVNYKTGHIPSV